MESIALVVASLALVLALVALVRGGRAIDRGGSDEASDARRRVENLREEVREELELQRRLLAKVAGGAKLTREMIEEGRTWDDVGAAAAREPLASGAWRALDVRTPQETASGMLAGALWIPIDQLEERLGELPRDEKPLLVYCAGGSRSAAACELLSRRGFEELHNLEGGIQSWPFGTVKPGASAR